MPIYKIEGKKDGLQKYRVQVSFYDEEGRRNGFTRTAYGRSEALQLEQDLRRSLKTGIKKELSQNLRELYLEYIAAKKGEVRDTTLEKIEIAFRIHILPELGKVKLDQLTPAVLQRWKNSLNQTDLAVRSKNNAFTMLQACLNYAVKMDILEKNPLDKLDKFRDPYEIPKSGDLHFYTPEQFLSYIQAARTLVKTPAHHGLFLFFMIAYYTGARKGEINALKWTDLEGNLIHIRRSVNVKGKTPRETPPKNKSSFRTIQIPDPLAAAINEHRIYQQSFPGFSDSWRVCGGPDLLADTSLDKFNRDSAALAGLPRIRIHDFRHSHASLLANNGINIQEVARRLGHSNVTETWRTYAHLYPQEEERALKILNQIV